MTPTPRRLCQFTHNSHHSHTVSPLPTLVRATQRHAVCRYSLLKGQTSLECRFLFARCCYLLNKLQEGELALTGALFPGSTTELKELNNTNGAVSSELRPPPPLSLTLSFSLFLSLSPVPPTEPTTASRLSLACCVTLFRPSSRSCRLVSPVRRLDAPPPRSRQPAEL